jgi:hypothetical protein
MHAHPPKLLALSVCVVGWLACGGGSKGPGGTGSSPGTAGTQAAGTAGDTGSGTAGATSPGTAGDNGGPGTAGASPGTAGSGTPGTAGSGTPGTAGTMGTAGIGGGAGAAGSKAGASGSGTAGAGTAGSGAAGMVGADPCGTPPWRPLHVTATAAVHTHAVAPNGSAFDGRVKPLGKIVVGMDVSSAGPPMWVVNRGYHGLGAAFGACAAPNLGAGRDVVGNCRLTQEWGKIKTDTIAAVKSLAASNPEEDWGYFLTQDGTDVRWSDVAFTGASHGATTSAVIGHLGACVWRVVSCAGPRDNTCGCQTGGNCTTGAGAYMLPYATNIPFNPACPDAKIASWLDAPSKTPIDRFYVIDGVSDGEYGDIMFNVERTKYPGQPVQFDVAGAVLTGTNRFISMGGGHLNYVTAAAITKPLNTDAVLNIAFAIPPENQIATP